MKKKKTWQLSPKYGQMANVKPLTANPGLPFAVGS